VHEVLHGDDVHDEAVNVAHASMLGLGVVITFIVAVVGLVATFVIGTAASFLWLLR
jgi:hypothetical protein